MQNNTSISGFRLPRWEALPELDLYMDQLISLLEKYLAPLIDADFDKVISRAIINNYVKLKIIPAPVKKRYTREHIAYLIVLCTLKSVLPLPVISKMLDGQLEQRSIDQVYNRFCEMAEVCMDQLGVMIHDPQANPLDIPFEAALLSATGAFLAQRLTLGQHETGNKDQ